MISQWQTFLGVLPTRWRRKPAGTDVDRNYVTVTLCIPLYRPWSGFLSKLNKLSPRGRRDDNYATADGSSTRGGSMSVRALVHNQHMAKLQAANVPIASGQTDERIAVSLNAPPRRGHNNPQQRRGK